MKKGLLLISVIVISLLVALYMMSSASILQDIAVEECVIQTKKIIAIEEGTSADIVFSDTQGDHYYINRGLERGLNLDSLNAKVLNKTVTLHLPNLWFGTSEHIAQLAIEKEVVFTEFE